MMVKRKDYLIADQRHPFMGLNNRTCKSPKYFCRLHRVWLSEDDVEKKNCKAKPDFNLIGVHRCPNLEKKSGE